MRSRLVPRQDVRRQVYKLDQPIFMTEAPVTVGNSIRLASEVELGDALG
jgi:hypothetical protein